MPIKVTCSNCGGVLHAPDDAGGKRGRCPTCGNILPIPAPATASGADLPPAPAAPPGQRPPSFADFAMGPQVGPPPGGATAAPARSSIPFAADPAPAPATPKRAAKPQEPKDTRRATDPFARKPAGNDEPPSEGLVKAWRRCRGGLGWVSLATWLLFIPAVLLPGYYTANTVVKAGAAEAKDLIPFKSTGYLGLEGVNSSVELAVLAGAVPVLLALVLTLFGRLGFAGGPRRAGVGGPGRLSALATLIGLCGGLALVYPNVFSLATGGPALAGGEGLFPFSLDTSSAVIQRLGMFIGLGALVVGEFWFASGVGRVGAALADGKTAARSTRYQMLLGLVVIGLVGTAAIAPSKKFGLWSPHSNTPASPVNPAYEVGKETNDYIGDRWAEYVSPLFANAGKYQPAILPGAFAIGGLLVWLVYVRLVGAARGAIRSWLDAHGGT